MDSSVVVITISGITALVTAMTPILLAMINKKQAQQLENSNKALVNSADAKVAAVETAAKVEDVKVAAVKTADKVEEVRRQATAVAQELTVQGAANRSQLDEIASVGRDTHTLVNSNMGVQLKLNAALSKRMADITKDADDAKAAELAKELYEEHLKKQAVVDAKTVTIQGQMITPRDPTLEKEGEP